MPKISNGLPWFDIHTNINFDDKVELFEAEFGVKGFGIWIKLLIKIYGDEGYFMKWNNNVRLLFAKRVGITGAVADEVVNGAVRRGLFDESVFNNFDILTSEHIQIKYFHAIKRRTRMREVDTNYLVIPHDDDIIKDNEYIKLLNVNINEQSRVEKSRVEKSRVEEELSETESQAMLVCEFLLENILSNDPAHKYSKNKPNLNSKNWLKEVERAIRLDGRTVEGLKNLITYTFTKSTRAAQFWSANIQSGKSLRAHYDKAKKQYDAEKQTQHHATNRKQTAGEELVSFYEARD